MPGTCDLSWLKERPIAHRGLHDMNQTRWENTLAAFEAAASAGYAIECDVRLAADGVPVVFHDAELERLTGADGPLWDRTAAELARLGIGRTAEGVPTLAEALALVDGRVPTIVEIKGAEGHDAGLVDNVAAALSGYRGHAAIMSFDHRLVRLFRSRAPGIPGGLTASGASEADLEAHFSMLAHGIAFVSFGIEDLPNRFAAFVRDRLAMPVVTWTVREEEAAGKALRYADQITFEGFAP